MSFFLSWRKRPKAVKRKKQYLYFPTFLAAQKPPSLCDGSLSLLNNNGFSFCNARGTAQAFLQALLGNEMEKAKHYFSHSVNENVDMERLRDLLAPKVGKCLFVEKKKGKYQTVSLAFVEKRELISFHMAEEPNEFGKWKIYGIEKE